MARNTKADKLSRRPSHARLISFQCSAGYKAKDPKASPCRGQICLARVMNSNGSFGSYLLAAAFKSVCLDATAYYTRRSIASITGVRAAANC